MQPVWNVAGGGGVGPGFGGVGEVFALEGFGDEEGGADAAVGDDEGFGDDGAGGADVEDGLDAFGLDPVGADGLPVTLTACIRPTTSISLSDETTAP